MTKHIIDQLREFAAEAHGLADAYCTNHEDDNSYDCGALARDAEDMVADLESGALQPYEAELEFADMRRQLDSIC
jgi:hypothetical protein